MTKQQTNKMIIFLICNAESVFLNLEETKKTWEKNDDDVDVEEIDA